MGFCEFAYIWGILINLLNMRSIYTLIICALSLFTVAQPLSDTIIVVKKATSISFYQDGRKLKHLQLRKSLATNKHSLRQYRSASVLRSASNICIGVGIIGTYFVLLYDVNSGDYVFKERLGQALIFGGGFALLSLPMRLGYRAYIVKAIHTYNRSLVGESQAGISMHFGLTPHGIGLSLRL